MGHRPDRTPAISWSDPGGGIRIVTRTELGTSDRWRSAFAQERKDHRYYELLEDTLREGFTYGYLSIAQDSAEIAIQPYFILDQDLLAGLGPQVKTLVSGIR